MIGTKGTVFLVEFAITDPRSKEVMWLSNDPFPNRQSAGVEARRIRKGGTSRVRIVKATYEVVWASDEAMVAAGHPVPKRRKR